MIGHNLPVLRPSKNRSKRLIKKLRQRLSTPMYGPVVTVQVKGKLLERLRAFETI